MNNFTEGFMQNNINNTVEISASEFKKHSLGLFDKVKNDHSSFTITKRKIPIAKVIPLNEGDNKGELQSCFGLLKGMVKVNSDIVNESFEDIWESNDE